MKRDNLNYVLVGLFVIAMTAAFVVLLFAVTGRSGPTDTYFVEYDNVSGLKFGTGVFYEGYRVGQIEEITPRATEEGMRYLIELSITSGWRIPSDSVASVASSGLISAVTIQIDEGASAEFLAPGASIAGRGQTDLFSVINQAASDFRTLSRDGIMPVLDNLNARITQVSEEVVRFRSDDLSPFVRMMHKRLDEDLIERSVTLLDELQKSAEGLENILGAENQTKVKAFLTHIDQVAVNLNDLVSRIETTRRQMDAVLGALDGVVEENREQLASTVDAAEASMDEMERALLTVNEHLGTILHNLESGSRHMSEFARSIREQPARLLRKSPATEPGVQ